MWLLCGCDERFARALAVTLHSTLGEIAPGISVRIVIVDNGMSADSRSRIRRVIARSRGDVDVSWADGNDLGMEGLLGARHISASTYLRLFAERLLPGTTDRVLYLDSDVLVRKDVSQFYDSDLQGKTVGAVRDMVIADFGHAYSGVTDYRELGIPAKQPYFNAGVLLIDLNSWRDKSYTPATLEYARKRSGEGNFDQDALNAVLHDDWQELDFRWNVQGSLLLLHEHPPNPWVGEMGIARNAVLRDPSIVHFSGTIKPWQPSSAHPFAAEWRRSLRTSGWYSRPEVAGWTIVFGAKQAVVKLLVASGRRPRRERVK